MKSIDQVVEKIKSGAEVFWHSENFPVLLLNGSLRIVRLGSEVCDDAGVSFQERDCADCFYT